MGTVCLKSPILKILTYDIIIFFQKLYLRIRLQKKAREKNDAQKTGHGSTIFCAFEN